MAFISKEEAVLKKHMEKEGLSLDKFPTMKAMVLAAMEEVSMNGTTSSQKPKTDKGESEEAFAARKLARSVESLLSVVTEDLKPDGTRRYPESHFAVKEARTRLDNYHRLHPEEKI